MRLRRLTMAMAGICLAAALTACGQKADTTTPASTAATEATTAESTTKESAKESTTAAATTAAESNSASEAAKAEEGISIRIGSMKGPTSMGLVSLMKKADNGETANTYAFNMVTAADELVALLTKEELDIAMIPANLASVLYNKNEGGITVLNINTLGVLDVVENGSQITSIQDLEGKTVYMTGQGTVPEYSFRYVLDKNGLTDKVTLEFKSEPTEVVNLVAETEGAVGLLPQPFVTTAVMQNDKLNIALNLTEEWDKVSEGKSSMVTGVTVVRTAFLEENEDAVKSFLADYKESVEAVNADAEAAAALIEEYGIVKAAVAKKALPYCSITYMDGEEMKSALSGYLESLLSQEAKSIGGKLPADNFYYIAK